ncbi:hypothetical protein Mapa_010838 [Marchantia paleacea]|nr:hypothetical protein Mapa_010838 [Marchantia paleacea]
MSQLHGNCKHSWRRWLSGTAVAGTDGAVIFHDEERGSGVVLGQPLVELPQLFLSTAERSGDGEAERLDIPVGEEATVVSGQQHLADVLHTWPEFLEHIHVPFLEVVLAIVQV